MSINSSFPDLSLPDNLASLSGAGQLSQLKRALAQARTSIFDAFNHHHCTGLDAAKQLSTLHDQLIFALYSLLQTQNPDIPDWAVVAVGGYGRAQMAPFSDIDLLILSPPKSKNPEALIPLLYRLWDLGLKVGHSVRTIEECIHEAKQDMTVRTALQEARLICGNHTLFQDLQNRYKAMRQGNTRDFVEEKLNERHKRLERAGAVRYSLEPNIKDGKGGLRDLQSLIWIAHELYGVSDITQLYERGLLETWQKARLERAERFLWTLRFYLHQETGRAEERLTFDLQENMAIKMGYKDRVNLRGVERFMRHYFYCAKAIGDFSRILLAALDEQELSPYYSLPPCLPDTQKVEGFSVLAGRLTVFENDYFAKKPLEMIRIYWAAHKHKLRIHPQAQAMIARSLRKIGPSTQQNPQANAWFIDILTSKYNPAPTLRKMNNSGVLGRFIPDFERIVGQMQFDRYHHYTVDEHSLFVIENLHKIESRQWTQEAPLSTQLFTEIASRKLLYITAFLHDIAKGRGGDHSTLGANVALKLCPRFGLGKSDTEIVSLLIKEHLTLSNTAFKRDLEAPETIKELSDAIQSTEVLRLLLILTVADISAVGPQVYNSWKAALLRRAYYSTASYLSGGLISEDRQTRIALRLQDLRKALPLEEAKRYIALGNDSYWLSYDTKTLRDNWTFLLEAGERETLHIKFDYNVSIGLSELIVLIADHPDNFSRLAGAIALCGHSINAARMHSLTNGMALYTLWLFNPRQTGPLLAHDTAKLHRTIEETINDNPVAWSALHKPRSALDKRHDVFATSPNVLVYNKKEDSRNLIEVSGHDKPGVLYQITHVLAKEGLIISTALIATYGTRFVDTFYVHHRLDGKIKTSHRIEQIKKRIIETLNDA